MNIDTEKIGEMLRDSSITIESDPKHVVLIKMKDNTIINLECEDPYIRRDEENLEVVKAGELTQDRRIIFACASKDVEFAGVDITVFSDERTVDIINN